MGTKQRWHRHKLLPPDIMERIEGLTTFFKENEVQLAYLFGSLTTGSGNDVDIAVLAKTDLSIIRERLQEALGTWRLDLANLTSLSPGLAFEIISTGKVIYRADDEIENLYEMNILKQYQDMRPVRDRQLRRLKENIGIGV